MSVFYIDSFDSNTVLGARNPWNGGIWRRGVRGGALQMFDGPNSLGNLYMTSSMYHKYWGFVSPRVFYHPSNYYGCGFWYKVGKTAIPDTRGIADMARMSGPSFLILFDFYYRVQHHLRVRSNGAIEACGHTEFGETNSPVFGSSPSGTLAPDEWAYIEWKANLGPSGNFTVRVNGETVIQAGGDLGFFGTSQYTDTEAQGKYAEMLNLSCWTWTGQDTGNPADFTSSYDSVYCFDSGGVVSDFLGPGTQVILLYPHEQGAYNQWTPTNDVTSLYRLQRHWHPNQLVRSTLDGASMTHKYGPLQLSGGTVHGVGMSSWRENANSINSYQHTVSLGGEVELGHLEDPQDGLPQYWDVFETAPGGALWNIDSVNQSEFGFVSHVYDPTRPVGVSNAIIEVLVTDPVWKQVALDNVRMHMLFNSVDRPLAFPFGEIIT